MAELVVTGGTQSATTTSTSTTTARGVLNDARNHLYRGHRDEKTRLTNALTATATTATFDFARNAMQANAKLSIDAEDINVWAVTSQSAASDMERGAFGTTAAEHAAGSVVTINPVVSDAELFTALNDELAALSGEGLFRVVSPPPWTSAANTAGYELPVDFLDVYEVRWESPGSSKNWPLLSSRDYSITRGLPTDEFPSGNALLIHAGIPTGVRIALRYRASFNRLVNLTDNVVSVSGIHAEALPLLAAGAALRVAAGRPVRRAHIGGQGSVRRAEEVSVTDGLAAPGALRQLRRDLLNAEVGRLAQRYPTRI